MKLSSRTIKAWSDMERKFLSYFFENNTEISVHFLFVTKQKEDKTVESFVESFREMLVRYLHGMSQETLVEIYKQNF